MTAEANVSDRRFPGHDRAFQEEARAGEGALK